MMNLILNPVSFLLYAAAIIVAITIHEFAHAFAADYLGDPTPRLQGRMTLNPLAHLDLLGTLALFLVRFGWGKPVQFDPFNLRNPRRDSAIISLAGPVSNLSLAVIGSFILRGLFSLQLAGISHAPLSLNIFASLLLPFLRWLVAINVVLAIFNLIPIHPLDGFKIVGGFLSADQAREWYALERYGMIFLLLLIFPIFSDTSPIQSLISPPINFLLSLLLPQPAII